MRTRGRYDRADVICGWSLRVNLIRQEPSGGKKFIMLDPRSTSDASYVEKRHRPFGRCYMIHPEHWIRELGISSIEVA